jgi:hypothetical protein
MIWDVLPFILSAVTIIAMWLAGRKDRRAWSLGLANQVLWLVFIWHTESWGLLGLTVALTWIYSQNYRRWSQVVAQP